MIYSVHPHTANLEGQRALCLDLAGHLLRRAGLWHATPTLDHLPGGAPLLANYPTLHYSQSHCRTLVAVALSARGRVGIDVESARHVGQALVQRVCTPAELQALMADHDPETAFIRLWTRKEAYLKCIGTGIKGYQSLVDAEDNARRDGYTISTLSLPQGFVSICHLATDPVEPLP